MPNDYQESRKRAQYKLRVLEQTEQWVSGISRHNAIDDECCPDFSCCILEMFEQNREKRAEYLAEFLRRHHFAQRMDS